MTTGPDGGSGTGSGGGSGTGPGRLRLLWRRFFFRLRYRY